MQQTHGDINAVFDRVADTILAMTADRLGVVIGITGPPGVGKTTAAEKIKAILAKRSSLVCKIVSLEDYYFEPHQREKLGYKWRAQPGTHDLPSLFRVLENVNNREFVKQLPRFDMARDRRAKPEAVNALIDVLILDGWIIKTELDNYAAIGDAISYMVFLGADIADCKRWRFQRESNLNSAGTGYPSDKMIDFWRSVLEPISLQYVLPQEDLADVVVIYKKDRSIDRVEFRRINIGGERS